MHFFKDVLYGKEKVFCQKYGDEAPQTAKKWQKVWEGKQIGISFIPSEISTNALQHWIES